MKSIRALRFPDRKMSLSRVRLMGVLNVTPDSFSDGGKFLDPSRAIERGKKLVKEGADIIDIGGESTRPGSMPITAEEEWERIGPVVEALATEVGVPVSVDTYKPDVARRALAAGASMINDINGLRNLGMLRLASERKIPVIIVHMKGEPRTMQSHPSYHDVLGEVFGFLRGQASLATKMGIATDRIVLDPGIGFGKTLNHNIELLRNLERLVRVGYPVMVGVSRKSFIGRITGDPVDERLEGSLSAAILAVTKGVKLLRVHDVAETRKAVLVAESILGH